MEFRVLQYFLTIANEESISRAAEVLHLTQPTLSRQIAQLEEELGAPLFVRGRRTVLTEAGMMLRKKAQEVSFLMDSIKTDFASRKDMSGVIHIGSGVYAGSNAVLAGLPLFMNRYPNVQFDIYTATADLLKERLDHGLLDFAVLQEPIDIGSYDYVRLREKDEWGLLVTVDHPLASYEAVTKNDLKGLRLILSRRGAVQGEFKNWLGNTVLPLAATINLNGNSLPLLTDGYAAVVTIRAAVEQYDPKRYRFIPLNPTLTTTTVLAWKKLNPVFGPAAEFLRYIQDGKSYDEDSNRQGNEYTL